MSENRLPDYLDHIQQAATDARSFVEGMAKDDFLADKRTQQAVIMSLIVIGEAATKVMDGYVEFTQAHADVPWRSMRNMRNRMAHGYFDINLDVVWETVQEWLPALLHQLPAVRQDADDEDRNDKGMEPCPIKPPMFGPSGVFDPATYEPRSGKTFWMAATDVSSLVGKEAAADTLIGNCTTARPASRSNSS